MNLKTTSKWIAVVGAGGLLACAGILAWQVRQRPVPGAHYVALGSSFAAGLGLGIRAPGSPVLSQRSIGGYPQHLSRMLKVPSFTDMTSSGSTVRQVLHGGQMGLGPQVDAVGPTTNLVTLSAGGNDVGYVGDLVFSAYRNRGGAVGFAVGKLWKGAKPASDRNFAALEIDLTDVLREIRRRAPNAQIVVATYAAILPATGTCAVLGITEDDADTLRKVGEKLRQITHDTALREQATLVDMATLSAGHDACSAEPWVNGASPEDGADFHPTSAGAQATARAIAEVIGK